MVTHDANAMKSEQGLWWHIYYGFVSEMEAYSTTVFGESTKSPDEVKVENPTTRGGELHYICSVDYDPEDYSGADSLVAQTLFDRLFDTKVTT